MGVDFYGHTIIGCKYPTSVIEAISEPVKERCCEHDLPTSEAKFCSESLHQPRTLSSAVRASGC